jgi:hypothetical protein
MNKDRGTSAGINQKQAGGTFMKALAKLVLAFRPSIAGPAANTHELAARQLSISET